MKKRVSFNKIISKRHEIFHQLINGNEFSSLSNALFIGANLHSDFANIKRIPKNIRTSSAFLLFEYIDLEAYLLKRTHVEIDFIRFDYKSPTFKKMAEAYIAKMDKLIFSFLHSVGPEEAIVVFEDKETSILKIDLWGYFAVSRKTLDDFGPITKNLMDENVLGITKYLNTRQVVRKCF